ncbi:MAG TPA: hypothetical protein PK954_15065 [Anaerolineales bacterium]|nr:hypothetical protein [Anaerolineales bacterium]HRF49411.1 hypothetical protein [Anaerolineales bacterium]
MKLPAPSDPRWRTYLLEGTSRPPLNFLALKIFLGRTEVTLKASPSENAVFQAIQQFRELLDKNQNLPSVQKDVAALFGSLS